MWSLKTSDYADVWKPVTTLLQQIEQRVSTYDPRAGAQLLLPEVLMGPLALRLSRAAASYFGYEDQFIEDAWKHFEALGAESKAEAYRDARFEQAPAYTSIGHEGRRLPKPFETIVETMRRLRDANTFRDHLAEVPSAAILGGSTSYGRFYNVRGALADNKEASAKLGNPSDLDFLIVIPNWESLRPFVKALARVPFIAKDSIDLGQRRAEAFEQLKLTDAALFSQKYDLWPEGQTDPVLTDMGVRQNYHVSIHIADVPTFERIIVRRKTIVDDAKDHLFDYRVDAPAAGIARGFDGYHQEFQHEVEDVELGKLAKLRIYDTDDKRFKPGLHQQLMLPLFEYRWDRVSPGVRLALQEFRWKILDRLRYERNLNPLRIQQLSLAHIRYHVFTPYIRRQIDEYELEY